MVGAPVVGVSRPEQLDDAVAAVEFRLDDEAAHLEAPYVPHAGTGFR